MLRFHCPSCGAEKPPNWKWIDDYGDGSALLAAHPYEPCVQCSECETWWRVELYEIEEE